MTINVEAEFGNIDIYLFDQILKKRFEAGGRILDAGCGGGRNLVYFLQNGYELYGVDRRQGAVMTAREIAAGLQSGFDPARIIEGDVTDIDHADGFFDAVICSAVLHFAESTAQFEAMLWEMWRVLKKGGLLFMRLASSQGMAGRITPCDEPGVYLFPDGSQRYLVSHADMEAYTERLGARLLDPIKSIYVQNQRCMATWCIKKL